MNPRPSNQTIALLLLGTIAISLGASMYTLSKANLGGLHSITGMALAPNGTATLTIADSSSIVFTASTVNWGTGSVNTTGGWINCTLNTDDNWNSGCSSDGSGFNELNHGFTIENDGNTNLTVELVSNKTAADFIGIASGAYFLWNVTLNESDACLNYTSVVSGDVSIHPNTSGNTANNNRTCGGIACGTPFENVTTTYKVICPRLQYANSADALNIDINVTIPVNAPTGVKVAALTVRGTRNPTS